MLEKFTYNDFVVGALVSISIFVGIILGLCMKICNQLTLVLEKMQ